VVGVYDPKWTERPLLIVTLNDGKSVGSGELIDHLRPQVAKWWLPDVVVSIDDMPHTATGKILKALLRKTFVHHLHFPEEQVG